MAVVEDHPSFESGTKDTLVKGLEDQAWNLGFLDAESEVQIDTRIA